MIKGNYLPYQASQRRRVPASEPAVIGVKRTLLLSLSWYMNDLMDDGVWDRSGTIWFFSIFSFFSSLSSFFLSHEREKMNDRMAHAEEERERSRLSCTACVVNAEKLIYALESSERRWNAVIRQMLSDTRWLIPRTRQWVAMGGGVES